MAKPGVIPPDVEDLVCTWLAARMTAHGYTLPVGTRVPTARPAEFLRVLAGSGNRGNLVQMRPIITVEAWAATETRASLLARTAWAILSTSAGEVVGGATIYRGTEFGLPANLPDPTSTQVRYSFTGELWLRAAAFTY